MIKSNVYRYILTTILLLGTCVSHANSVVDQRIKELIPIYKSGNLVNIKRATAPLAWSGISSTKLYDTVEERLLSNADSASKEGIDMSGWLIKALSYSGDQKYVQTLESISKNSPLKKVKRYAQQGIDRLYNYKQWNQEISKNLTGKTKAQVEQQRLINLLQSKEYELVRLGAKRLAYAHKDDSKLLTIAQKRLLADYQNVANDKLSIDVMIWLCKALAETGDSKYKAVLEQVGSNAPNKKLAKRAAKYASVL